MSLLRTPAWRKVGFSLIRISSANFSSVVNSNRVNGKTTPEYDICIVGGGIVGAATARELITRHPNLKFGILEKENKLAAHQSGHNSGVIHCGVFYTPGSLKAKLCVDGLHLAYKFCDEHNIPYKKCGKLIVAVDKSEIPRLEVLYERGLKNKAPGVQMIGPDKIREIEPHCKGIQAVWCPDTGIVDWSRVCVEYSKHFEKRGGKIHLGFEVTGLSIAPEGSVGDPSGNRYPLRIESKTGATVRSRHVLTCGGLFSDRLAMMSGGSSDPRIIPFRGEYLLLNPDKCHLIKGNIYPVPDPKFPFLGVHFTPRMDGSVWLGPNAVLAFKREGYRYRDFSWKDFSEAIRYRGFQRLMLNYLTFGATETYRSIFISAQLKELQKCIPQITRNDISRGPAGVRAQAMSPDGKLVDDFVFDGGKGELSERVLHVRNAPSPGATSSLAIAKMIADKAAEQFHL